MDDGYIDITLFETSPLQFAINFPRIYFGTFQKTQRHYKAKRILIRGQNLHIQYHGELLGIKDEIEINVLPKALKVIAPAEPSPEIPDTNSHPENVEL
jgi:diacylglycerol kinase family enzyme